MSSIGMEGNISTGNMIPVSSYNVMDPQGSMQRHHPQLPHGCPHHNQQQPNQSHHDQGSMVNPPTGGIFALPGGSMHEKEQQPTARTMDYNKNDHGKTIASDEDDRSFNTEDIVDGHHESEKGVKASPWHRMKWTGQMVRLLITIMSYLGEDAASEYYSGWRRKLAMLQKKGKWKLVSKVLSERGYNVLPQQCEDKFNDLNKRYKRLVDILGRGTSCQVVENPMLLDFMPHISDKAKDDVRKILSSKHLFYEEMCSYHNGNRLHLPADPAIQRSLRMLLIGKDEHGSRRAAQDDINEEDQGTDSDDGEDDAEENNTVHEDIKRPCSQRKMKHGMDHEDGSFKGHSVSLDCNKRPHPQSTFVDMNQVFPEMSAAVWAQKEWVKSRWLQLEEQKLQIEAQMLDLEKQRFKWQQFSKKKDKELEKMRLENERMKLENERLALELKRKEFDIGLK